ncbi:MAG: hypothetical protein LIO67_11105, partial [Lachnospiraceae bacterium]|nr:hypothetical protein [Lachnospiraceae bacterium]
EDLFKALFNYQGSSAVRSLKGSDQMIISNIAVTVKHFFIFLSSTIGLFGTLTGPFSRPARL